MSDDSMAAEEIEVYIHDHEFHDASFDVPKGEDGAEADGKESSETETRKKRKILRGKITRAITRLNGQMSSGEIVQKHAVKQLRDLRIYFDEAIDLNSKMYSGDEEKISKWEDALIKDFHEFEVTVDDYFKEQKSSVTVEQSVADVSADHDDESDGLPDDHDDGKHDKQTVTVDGWIDELIEFSETKLPDKFHGEKSVLQALYRLEASREIPVMKIETFDGSPLKYVEFVDSFYIQIHAKPHLTDDIRMAQLKMALSGEAAKTISGLGSSGTFYASALKTVKQQYGHKSIIARAFIRKLTNDDRIRSAERQKLRDVSMDVVNTLSTLNRINYMSDVNATETLREIIQRLPEFLVQRWKTYAAKIRDKGLTPDLKCINDFLRTAVKAEFDPDFGDLGSRVGRQNVHGVSHVNPTSEHQQQKWQRRCPLCSDGHKTSDCPTFLGATVKERLDIIKINKLCYSCLNKGHVAKDCRSKRLCGLNNCKRTHHCLIHVDPNRASALSGALDKPCIMPVVCVRFRAYDGRTREGNVLIDGGAGTTLIRKEFSNFLGLQGKREWLNVSVVGGGTNRVKTRRVKVWLSSLDGSQGEFPVEAYEIDETVVDVQPLDRSWLSSFDHLKDVSFSHKGGPVDLILGVQYSHLHAEQEVREGRPYEPVGKRTRLGWCVLGCDSDSVPSGVVCSVGYCAKLDPDLERLYDLETLGIKAPVCDRPKQPMSTDDRKSLELLESSCQKVGNRYEVGLPWKQDREDLPNNYEQAKKRLESLERNLKSNPVKAELYQKTITSYVENDWAEEVKDKTGVVYYLLHHGVYREDKPSTPLRVVFDPTLLNSFLYKGPSLLGDLLGILIRFREKPVAFHGDISKMFLQILLPEQDTHVHGYLWRDLDNKAAPKVYKLKRVTFGDKPSPDMANFVMLKIAEEHKDVEPEAAEVLRRDRYMDDIIHSCEDGEEAKELTERLDQLLKTGGFQIKKWFVSTKAEHWTDMCSSEERIKALGMFGGLLELQF